MRKKKIILPFGTMRMKLEDIMLSEISLTEKDKYSVILLICGRWAKWMQLVKSY